MTKLKENSLVGMTVYETGMPFTFGPDQVDKTVSMNLDVAREIKLSYLKSKEKI